MTNLIIAIIYGLFFIIPAIFVILIQFISCKLFGVDLANWLYNQLIKIN